MADSLLPKLANGCHSEGDLVAQSSNGVVAAWWPLSRSQIDLLAKGINGMNHTNSF